MWYNSYATSTINMFIFFAVIIFILILDHNIRILFVKHFNKFRAMIGGTSISSVSKNDDTPYVIEGMESGDQNDCPQDCKSIQSLTNKMEQLITEGMKLKKTVIEHEDMIKQQQKTIESLQKNK